MNTELAIDIKHANVFLGGREIIHDLNWQVAKGGRCFILGANGAGKTTLVKTMMGYAWPKFGATVDVLGNRFGQTNLVELRKKIAWVSPFMSQFTNTESTGLEMVLSGFDGTLGLTRKATAEEVDTAKALMERFRCAHLIDQEIFTMSSGEQVKIMIARALLNDPQVLLADEPTGNLDPVTADGIMQLFQKIASQGCAVVMSTHNTALIENYPARAVLFSKGRIREVDLKAELA